MHRLVRSSGRHASWEHHRGLQMYPIGIAKGNKTAASAAAQDGDTKSDAGPEDFNRM
ncbi:MAG: hypothetical protein KDB00_07755 [Planctomycetales bacterium]|nr:hypothetical protein [Planctomycetales bacterium]